MFPRCRLLSCCQGCAALPNGSRQTPGSLCDLVSSPVFGSAQRLGLQLLFVRRPDGGKKSPEITPFRSVFGLSRHPLPYPHLVNPIIFKMSIYVHMLLLSQCVEVTGGVSLFNVNMNIEAIDEQNKICSTVVNSMFLLLDALNMKIKPIPILDKTQVGLI